MQTLNPVSNQATWQDTIEFVNDETGVAWFQDDDPPTSVTLKVRDRETGEVVLSGSLGSELVVIADGTIQFTFAATAMSALCSKTYDVGVLYTDAGVTAQTLIAALPVYEGL